jgi:YfiH family protein
MLQVKRQDQMTFLQSEALAGVPGIVHGFSTRRWIGLGDPNVRLLATIGAVGWPILKLKQIHSGSVVEMKDTSAASEPIEGDAAVTALKDVIVGVRTADCVPILIADSRGTAVAAVHAGWRGTAARIAEATVARLLETFSIDPKNLVAAIGPRIGVCCYEVGPDVVEAIGDPTLFEGRHLNLGEANRRQLLDAGLAEEHIEVSSLCTKCREDLFHSYRRDGKKTGHMLSVIGIAS